MANKDYPDGDEQTRQRIFDSYKSYTLGLLYFLQNDAELPDTFRGQTAAWGFCKDEFKETGGLSRELYIREARRIKGRKVFTSHDVFLSPGTERTPVHTDSIAVADYQVDSHIVQRKQADWPQYEGHVYLRPISKPAQVPFGVMVPETVKSLLVPGAVSATHLGFSVLRMEPVWMAMGQAAGTAAAMALEEKINVRDVSIDKLQYRLLNDGQVISFFYDVGVEDKLWELLNIPFEKAQLDHVSGKPKNHAGKGLLYFATKGFFNTYYARPSDPVTRYEAVEWLHKLLQFAGRNLSSINTANHFADVDESHVLARPIMQLIANGIAAPWRDTGNFFGAAAISRIDALRWISNSFEKLSDEALNTAALWKEFEQKNWLPDEWISNEPDPEFYCTRQEFLDILYSVYLNDQKLITNQKAIENDRA